MASVTIDKHPFQNQQTDNIKSKHCFLKQIRLHLYSTLKKHFRLSILTKN